MRAPGRLAVPAAQASHPRDLCPPRTRSRARWPQRPWCAHPSAAAARRRPASSSRQASRPWSLPSHSEETLKAACLLIAAHPPGWRCQPAAAGLGLSLTAYLTLLLRAGHSLPSVGVPLDGLACSAPPAKCTCQIHAPSQRLVVATHMPSHICPMHTYMRTHTHKLHNAWIVNGAPPARLPFMPEAGHACGRRPPRLPLP